MIINVKELTNFKSGHSRQAEIAVMNALCFLFDLEPKEVTQGNAPEYDFRIQNTTIELKISSKGTTDSVIELCKASGEKGGLTATTADLYAFLNPAGPHAKLRLIRTYELRQFYNRPSIQTFRTETVGDKIGSILAPLNFKDFDDLMVAQCLCYLNKDNVLEFDTSTFKANSFGAQKIREYIR